jgi:hypothetical protein
MLRLLHGNASANNPVRRRHHVRSLLRSSSAQRLHSSVRHLRNNVRPRRRSLRKMQHAMAGKSFMSRRT